MVSPVLGLRISTSILGVLLFDYLVNSNGLFVMAVLSLVPIMSRVRCISAWCVAPAFLRTSSQQRWDPGNALLSSSFL